MSERKSKEAILNQVMKKYQRRYNPVYMSLVSKEEFLDIINLEDRTLTHDEKTLRFSEEEWMRFKDNFVRGFTNFDFDKFISIYFPDPSNYTFDTKCNDVVCAFIWKCGLEKEGGNYFEKSGAAMIREMGDYWIFMLFSSPENPNNTFEVEMSALRRLIDDLESMDQ